MESQESITKARRTGSNPAIIADNATATVSADAAKSKSGEADAKASDSPETGKKHAKVKCSKKHAKQEKTKKSKKSKTAPVEEESDDSSDEETSDPSSSDADTTESDSEFEDAKRHKKSTKKKAESSKSKKNSRAKKGKKPAKTHDTVSESDSDTSDSDSGDETADVEKERKELALRMQMLKMQQNANPLGQFQQYPGASAGLTAGFGGGYGGGYLGGYGGGFNPGFNPGFNGGYAAGLGGINNGYTGSYIFPGGAPMGGLARGRRAGRGPGRILNGLNSEPPIDDLGSRKKSRQKKAQAAKLNYKRVDQVWDTSIHNYKLQDTTETSTDAEYEDSLFHVRRTFDWEGKYKQTIVDMKSKLLRECLQEVMGNIKGVSLVEETPKLDPNMLFLYLEDLRKYREGLEEEKSDAKDKRERKREQKRIAEKRQHLKVLIKYLDKDYAQVKKSLYPMLENGLITFDLLWALWKPNTLAYTPTYSSHDEPRVFKVEMAEKHFSIVKGDFYYIEGKYFEFDGKQFGYGSMSEELAEFRGARKITSLSCYPLQYHKNEAQLRQDLVERGKKFVRLSGVHYKSHQGMAYLKKKKAVIKVNINGRIMVDAAIHRRINPNYPISLVRPKDHDVLSDDDSDDDLSCGGCGSDSESGLGNGDDKLEKVKYVKKVIQDEKGKKLIIRLPQYDDDEEEPTKEKLDEVPVKSTKTVNGDDDEADSKITGPSGKEDAPLEFSDEEYLIASPVVLGFAFAEKMWLEFTVSGVKEIQWNETAYESLVLEAKTKDIVKALVESHKYHAAESIDDVIQGKGKGLVAVLHGPPGTGKTLTAEGISELLKCPLYMVSAGELGTDSRYLEAELQKILDICHAWGAILLLDEADVFLEKRNMHDLHRNALVSIFLRQLEYFQGILFLTTNRVETFDDAFQSRIHIALRYDALDQRAKKAIFKIFIERVRIMENITLMPFSEEDYTALAKHELNGRQIKNTVRTAQALAVNKGEPLSMKHIRQVLDVLMSFDRDLKGGPGYQDAMRSYF